MAFPTPAEVGEPVFNTGSLYGILNNFDKSQIIPQGDGRVTFLVHMPAEADDIRKEVLFKWMTDFFRGQGWRLIFLGDPMHGGTHKTRRVDLLDLNYVSKKS